MECGEPSAPVTTKAGSRRSASSVAASSAFVSRLTSGDSSAICSACTLPPYAAASVSWSGSIDHNQCMRLEPDHGGLTVSWDQPHRDYQ